jgi:hypothetical protein
MWKRRNLGLWPSRALSWQPPWRPFALQAPGNVGEQVVAAPPVITHEVIPDISIGHRGRECVQRKNDGEEEGEGDSHGRQIKRKRD